ncbi:MAG TPA: sigma 54-interacting transcriptional regulator [Thermoanaerobaculia bacterium]|nr:sigma 54-interacting transcriptional regulator [Thermoanaerobaculia bacterium]
MSPSNPCPTSGEEKYRLLLQVSEAANARRDLAGVLEAVARALKPFVPVDAIAAITIEGDVARTHAIHIEGVEHRPGEPVEETVARALDIPRENLGALQSGFPLKGTGTEFVGRTGRAYVAQDLAEDRLFAEDERLLSYGVHSYVRTPLFVRDRQIGSISFARIERKRFTTEEAELLEEVSRPIATAVSNSLAFAEIARLKDRLQEENLVLKEEIDQESMFEEIVGSSREIRDVLARVEKVARTDSTVLLCGETGTGKELIARAIHRLSPRASHALIKVNLAALPDGLVASELFGHEKGAFTGALQRRIGRFELAAGGTLFLDEVSELSPEMQVALLRVLQEGEFERVGGNRTLHTDARVIAATNRDLSAAVSEGAFREDLYYRLNVFPIELPPLRERRSDIPVLVEYFVARHAARLGKRIRRVEKKTMDLFLAYPWPGNVRELQNVIERAAILTEGDTLRIEEKALNVEGGAAPAGSLPSSLQGEEKRMIEAALAQTRGRVSGPSGAAARLRIPSTTLESKIRKLRIDKHRFRSIPAPR